MLERSQRFALLQELQDGFHVLDKAIADLLVKSGGKGIEDHDMAVVGDRPLRVNLREEVPLSF